MDSTTVDRLLDLGLALIELRGKRPVAADWPNRASRDPETVRQWARTGNIGVVCGNASGGLLVVDVDVNGKPGMQSLEAAQQRLGQLPKTFTVATGSGGLHFYFHVSELLSNSAGKLGEGIDTRGQGGQVVAPGSTHPDTGQLYAVEVDAPIAELPAAWAAALGRRKAQAAAPTYSGDELAGPSAAPFERFELPAVIPDGQRNDTLYRYACSLQAKGVADDQIAALVDEANASLCKPPVAASEIDLLLGSALRHEKGQPRGQGGALLLQHQRSYYVQAGGDYEGPYVDTAAVARFRTLHLETPGVDLITVTQRGSSKKTLPTLIDDYGAVVADVTYDLRAQATSYDAERRILTIASAPRAAVTARRHEVVERWLELLAGDKLPKVLDWLATVADLDRPSCALVFVGPPGVGKSLFAAGLARLWGRAEPVPLDLAMARFSQPLTSCPLVFGDEMVPQDWKGRNRSEELRRLITATERMVEAKFAPVVALRGALRVLIASNSDNVLDFGDDIGAHDVAAIAGRLCVVSPSAEAGAYLARLRATGTGGELFNGLALAEHTMWLSETRQRPAAGRYAVEGDVVDVARHMATSGWLASELCRWCVEWLLDDTTARAQLVGDGAQIVEGTLRVTSQAVERGWAKYVQRDLVGKQRPRVGQLGRALSQISAPARGKLRTTKGRIHCYVVDTSNLVSWAEEHGFADEETLRRALS